MGRSSCFLLYGRKNRTVTLPDEKAPWLRVRADEQDRSVSRWLAEMIEGMRRDEGEYEVAMDRFPVRARSPRRLACLGGRRPIRKDLCDRSGLR